MKMQQTLDLIAGDALPPLDKRFAKRLHKKLLAEFGDAVSAWPKLSEEERADWRDWVGAPLPTKAPAEGFSQATMAHLQAISERLQYAETRAERLTLRAEMQVWMTDDGACAPFSFAMCARYEACDAEELRASSLYSLHKLDVKIESHAA